MSNQEYVEYPIEKFYNIEGHDELFLRLTIGLSNKQFWVECDLITVEGRKILKHLGRRQHIDTFFDATQIGLSFYHSLK